MSERTYTQSDVEAIAGEAVRLALTDVARSRREEYIAHALTAFTKQREVVQRDQVLQEIADLANGYKPPPGGKSVLEHVYDLASERLR